MDNQIPQTDTQKICIHCETPKQLNQFRKPTKNICMKCEIIKIQEKMLKFIYTDIGLEGLDTTLETIVCKSKYLTSTYSLPTDKAIEYILKGKAQVYRSDMIYRTDFEDENWIVRYEVLERDNYICHYCKKDTDETVDHIIPKSHDGDFTHENLVCCCHECNALRGDMKYKVFKRYFKNIKEKYDYEETQKIYRELKYKENLGKKKSKHINKMPSVLLKHQNKYGY